MRKIITTIIFALTIVLLVSCSKKDDAVVISTVEELDGHSISVIAGSFADVVMSQNPNVQLLRLPNSPECILAVEKSQADFSMMDSMIFMSIDLESRGLMVDFATEVGGGNIAFPTNYNDEKLGRELDEYIQKIKANGEIDEIYARWTSKDSTDYCNYTPKVNPNGEELIVATMPDTPFSFVQNGKWVGFEIEIIDRFAYETGRCPVYQNYNFDGVIAALVTGKIDLAACCMTDTEERAKQIRFSVPYYYNKSAIVGRIPGWEKTSKESAFTRIKESFHNNLILEKRWKLILQGLWETVVLSFFSILLGTLLGSVVCAGRVSKNRLIRKIAVVYIDLMRGLPVLVLLMVMFYVILASSGMSGRWVAIITFAMNFAAYVSEMFRSGIEGIDKGQTEAGLALGFSKVKTFILFILPQAMKNVIPVYKGEAISLIKNTSVVGYIAIQDLTKMSDVIRSRTFDAFFPLIFISIIYFIIAWLFGKALDSLAKTKKI